jgi:hypothetical protein
MWIRVTETYTHRVRPGVKIRYRPGTYSVPSAIGNAAIENGKAEKTPRPKPVQEVVADGEAS